MPSKSIDDVLAAHRTSLRSVRGVTGVEKGEFDGKPCIKVTTDKRTRKLMKQIPKSLDGFIVLIEETGEFRTRQKTPPY
jgi:hypothetical protein